MGTFALLMLASVASMSAQTPSVGHDAIQSKQPPSPAALTDGVTPPVGIGEQVCLQFYPPIAIRLNQQGTTIVIVHVTPTGTVDDATVKATSGHDALDEASVRCVSKWTFRPATKDGAPVAAYKEFGIRWMLARGSGPPPPPVPFLPPGAPAGWELEGQSYLTGDLASYKLSQAPITEQYLSAKAYWNFPDLRKFIAQIDTNLQSIKSIHVLGEVATTVCGGVPASEIEFSEPGLVAGDPNRVMDVEQVRAAKDGWGYVTTYIRPTDSPKRPDAEQWIHTFCQTPGSNLAPEAPHLTVNDETVRQ